jgi:hypothetical protein
MVSLMSHESFVPDITVINSILLSQKYHLLAICIQNLQKSPNEYLTRYYDTIKYYNDTCQYTRLMSILSKIEYATTNSSYDNILEEIPQVVTMQTLPENLVTETIVSNISETRTTANNRFDPEPVTETDVVYENNDTVYEVNYDNNDTTYEPEPEVNYDNNDTTYEPEPEVDYDDNDTTYEPEPEVGYNNNDTAYEAEVGYNNNDTAYEAEVGYNNNDTAYEPEPEVGYNNNDTAYETEPEVGYNNNDTAYEPEVDYNNNDQTTYEPEVNYDDCNQTAYEPEVVHNTESTTVDETFVF